MDTKELKKLISSGEGIQVDFKSDLPLLAMEDLSKDFAAFANSEGGHIIVGVSDTGEILGVDTDDKISQIHQEALHCRPPVTVKVTEEVIEKVKLIIIEIPKGNWIHSDKRRRFPQRFGERTDFMETSMILNSARALGLITGEGRTVYETFTRTKHTQAHLDLVQLLDSGNPTIIREALRDLESASPSVKIENINGLFDKMITLLGDSKAETRFGALSLIERMQYNLTPTMKAQYKSKISGVVRKLAAGDNDLGTRTKAVYLMMNSAEPEGIYTIMDIIKKEPSIIYNKLNPANNVIRLVEKGLGPKMRSRLYEELLHTHIEETEKRILVFLTNMRHVPWPT